MERENVVTWKGGQIRVMGRARRGRRDEGKWRKKVKREREK